MIWIFISLPLFTCAFGSGTYFSFSSKVNVSVMAFTTPMDESFMLVTTPFWTVELYDFVRDFEGEIRTAAAVNGHYNLSSAGLLYVEDSRFSLYYDIGLTHSLYASWSQLEVSYNPLGAASSAVTTSSGTSSPIIPNLSACSYLYFRDREQLHLDLAYISNQTTAIIGYATNSLLIQYSEWYMGNPTTLGCKIAIDPVANTIVGTSIINGSALFELLSYESSWVRDLTICGISIWQNEAVFCLSAVAGSSKYLTFMTYDLLTENITVAQLLPITTAQPVRIKVLFKSSQFVTILASFSNANTVAYFWDLDSNMFAKVQTYESSTNAYMGTSPGGDVVLVMNTGVQMYKYSGELDLVIPNLLQPIGIGEAVMYGVDLFSSVASVNFFNVFGDHQWAQFEICDAGYQAKLLQGDDIGTCESCPPGQFKPFSLNPFTPCNLCPYGTSNDDFSAISSSSCVSCTEVSGKGCPMGSPIQLPSELKVAECSSPEYEASASVSLDGSYYTNNWIDILVVSVLVMMIGLLMLYLPEKLNCGLSLTGKTRAFLKYFGAFESSQEDAQLKKDIWNLFSLIFTFVGIMLISFYIYVSVNLNTQIEISSKPLKSFPNATILTELDTVPITFVASYAGWMDASRCTPQWFSVQYDGITPTATLATNVNTTYSGSMCTATVSVPTSKYGGVASVSIQLKTPMAVYFQYLKYSIATQNTQGFSCSSDSTVTATTSPDQLCSEGVSKLDSMIENYIFPGNNQVMRGTSKITITSSLTYLQKCSTVATLGAFRYYINSQNCEYCKRSGKTLSLYDASSTLSPAAEFYSGTSASYTVTFEVQKFQLYREVSIGPLISVGALVLSMILTLAGLKDLIEILLGIASFLIKIITNVGKTTVQAFKKTANRASAKVGDVVGDETGTALAVLRE